MKIDLHMPRYRRYCNNKDIETFKAEIILF